MPNQWDLKVIHSLCSVMQLLLYDARQRASSDKRERYCAASMTLPMLCRGVPLRVTLSQPFTRPSSVLCELLRWFREFPELSLTFQIRQHCPMPRFGIGMPARAEKWPSVRAAPAYISVSGDVR